MWAPDRGSALQFVKGNVVKRLQINDWDNKMTYYRSEDGGNTWPLVKNLLTVADVNIFNILGFDVFYDAPNNASLVKWRIRDNLHYQLFVNDREIGLDRWDGAHWTRQWTK